jgi:hypothetical protein
VKLSIRLGCASTPIPSCSESAALIDSLCRPENPVVAWRARRLLAGESEQAPAMRRLRAAIGESALARRRLKGLRGERFNPWVLKEAGH